MGCRSSKLEASNKSESTHHAGTHPSDLAPAPHPYNRNDIWKNKFVHTDYCDVGQGSLHFISTDKKGKEHVYLSFEDPQFRKWTLFDGTTPWPIKMPFTSFQWNATNRTFNGVMKIRKCFGSGVKEVIDYGGAEEEVTKWVFFLCFDEHFKRVVYGSKDSYIGDSPVGTEEYGDKYINTYTNASVAGADEIVGKEGCIVEDTAYRGITLRQILKVKEEIHRRCVAEGWQSTNPDLCNKILEPEDVTLYDLVEHFIKPITKTRRCSYMEMVASGPQSPNWFVSHWWGGTVLEFIKCIQGHARDRKQDLDTVYWICAYANNQWNVDEEVGHDPKESSFHRAMDLSQGTVSVLDRHAVCYTRIWCSYELFLSVVEFNKEQDSRNNENQRHIYDAYAIGEADGKGIAVGLTDGPAAIDNDDVSWQTRRQSYFPLSPCETALRVEIVNSDASQWQDKNRILNSICGNVKDLLAQPPDEHLKYNEVDSLLRGRFVSSIYRRMLEAGNDMKPLRKALSEAPLSYLGFSFFWCDKFRDEASQFVLSLPKSLEMIDFDYVCVGFESSDEFAVGFRHLQNLKSLKLNITGNPLSCTDRLGEEVCALTQLNELELRVNGPKITSFGAFAVMLKNLSQLETLKLYFAFHKDISDASILAESLSTLTKIKTLTFDFSDSSLSKNVILELCRAVVELDNLQHLHLSFNGVKAFNGKAKKQLCRDFYDIKELKRALKDV